MCVRTRARAVYFPLCNHDPGGGQLAMSDDSLHLMLADLSLQHNYVDEGLWLSLPPRVFLLATDNSLFHEVAVNDYVVM